MELYPYQKRVRKYLRAGKSVIVQAPTGAGKTRAALYPYFEMLDQAKPGTLSALPSTCRYAVPMRVLATQFEREHRDYFANMDQKRGTDFMRRYHEQLDLDVPAIQTGETPNDPEFASPLTFCTIDQLLASFIGTPYSISRRLANLNVGAIAGSYLILDEFHLYPLDGKSNGARTTTIAMLRMLQQYSPFVLMTATFSSHLLNELAALLDAKVVRVGESDEGEPDDTNELDTIMRGRMRSLQLARQPMKDDIGSILVAHQRAKARGAGASLIVCNTVARAQEIYLQLCATLEDPHNPFHLNRADCNLMLLHSRFTPTHRHDKSTDLETWLGKDQWHEGRFLGKDTIVVGTQAIEVGLNISCGVLHTELAPANSLIQRAGRCARFEQQRGEVIVYPIPPRETTKPDAGKTDKNLYLPYQKQTCEKTWEEIAALVAANGGHPIDFDFTQEQRLIDAIHTPEDQAMLAEYRLAETNIQKTIMGVLQTHERGKEGLLIRNVAQVNILIHADPNTAITTEPFNWESFGLHPQTLIGAWDALNQRKSDLDLKWTMKYLFGIGDDGKDEDDNARPSTYNWDKVTNPEQIKTALRIALPPELATYDKELGFRLLLADDAKAKRYTSEYRERQCGKDKKRGGGSQQSYVEHISGLFGAYQFSMRDELAWLAAKLEAAMQLPIGSIDHAVRLAIACHDIGKLSQDWQHWAHKWQEFLIQEKHDQGYAVQPGREFLAKTDRLQNWQEDRSSQKALSIPRPHHACEGAMASASFLTTRILALCEQVSQESALSLYRAVVNAIARHHAPLSCTYNPTTWNADALHAVAAALKRCQLADDLTDLTLEPLQEGAIERDWLIVPERWREDQGNAVWLGFAIVRALRLCDQRADLFKDTAV